MKTLLLVLVTLTSLEARGHQTSFQGALMITAVFVVVVVIQALTERN